MQEEASAGALFNQGRLTDAIAAAAMRVRKAPGAAASRMLLAELLLFQGDLTRADNQADTAANTDPDLAIAVAEFRQLLRGQLARVQLLGDGRVPEFLDAGPTAAQQAALACVVALRDGDSDAAAAHAAAAEDARPPVPFSLNGKRIQDLRDADDLIGGSLEVLTTTGKYMWIPLARVAALTLHPPERPRDLCWRRATLAVADGPNGEVYVPAIYAADKSVTDEALRLGRVTDWQELTDGLTLGVGQRLFLAGDDGVPVMDIATLVRLA